MFQQKNCCTHAFSRDAAGFDKTETFRGLNKGHKIGCKLQNHAPIAPQDAITTGHNYERFPMFAL